MGIEMGDVMRVAARMAWKGLSDIINTWWLRCIDDHGLDLEDLLDDLLEVIEAVYAEFDNYMANDVTFEDMQCQNMTNTEVYGSLPWPSLTVGGGTGQALPPQLAVFAATNTYVPNCKGRKFFGAFTEQEQSEGLWLYTECLSHVVAGLALTVGGQVGSNGSTWQFVTPHYVEDGEELPVPEYYYVTGWYVSEFPSALARRHPARGS